MFVLLLLINNGYKIQICRQIAERPRISKLMNFYMNEAKITSSTSRDGETVYAVPSRRTAPVVYTENFTINFNQCYAKEVV